MGSNVNAIVDLGQIQHRASDIDQTRMLRTGKLVMGILALIAEFENDIRHERQMGGIAKARDRKVSSDESGS
jgi:DNA invertase Pin-like site-specific DNA recombinase